MTDETKPTTLDFVARVRVRVGPDVTQELDDTITHLIVEGLKQYKDVLDVRVSTGPIVASGVPRQKDMRFQDET